LLPRGDTIQTLISCQPRIEFISREQRAAKSPAWLLYLDEQTLFFRIGSADSGHKPTLAQQNLLLREKPQIAQRD
jgi:hypothetical protein